LNAIEKTFRFGGYIDYAAIFIVFLISNRHQLTYAEAISITTIACASRYSLALIFPSKYPYDARDFRVIATLIFASAVYVWLSASPSFSVVLSWYINNLAAFQLMKTLIEKLFKK
jgi:hypothetical protein